MTKLNETLVQNHLYWHLRSKNHEPICSNIYAFEWESDMLSMTRANYSVEFEIKMTRSDFLAESKKVWRKYVMDGENADDRKIKYAKHLAENGYTDKTREIYTNKLTEKPNYFWWAVPQDLITLDDIRPTDGLIYFNYVEPENRRQSKRPTQMSIVRSAKLIHKEKYEHLKERIYRSLYYKYWNTRLKSDESKSNT